MRVSEVLAAKLRSCLGPEVAVASADARAHAHGLVGGEEDALVDSASPRAKQFSAGRRAARTALQSIGVSQPEILVGERGQPIWPTGYTGSITHTDDIALAAVARQTRALRSLGIDCEPLGGDPAALHRGLSLRELESLSKLADAETGATRWVSAKEAYFKAQYPITGAFLAFRDVEVSPAGSKLVCLKILAGTAVPCEHTLHSVVCEGHVLSAILLPEDL